MKKLILSFVILSSTTQAAIEYRGETYHQDKLWKVAAPKEMIVQFESNPALEQKCTMIEAIAAKYRGRELTQYIINHYDRMRDEPLAFDFPNDLYPEFKLQLPNEVEFQALYQTKETPGDGVSLPYFGHDKSLLTHWIPSVTESVPKVVANENSLTEFSQSLGLTSLEPVIKKKNNAFVVEVRQLDLACDLFQGRAYLSAEIETYVSPTKEHQEKLNTFYNEKMAPIVTEIFELKKSATVSAALYGGQLGQLLNQELGDLNTEEMTGFFLKNLEVFFDDQKFQPKNPLFKDSNYPYQVAISGYKRTYLTLIIQGVIHE